MKKSLERPIDPGDFIKHEKFMDICMQVEYCFEVSEGEWMVTGYWWNQGWDTKSWMIPFKDLKKRRSRDPYAYGGGYGPDTQSFKIKAEDLPKWFKLKQPPRSQCLRKCEWKAVA